MDDRRGISIRCIARLDRSLDVGYKGYRGIKYFKLFYQKTRTYGILFLYLYIISNKRDMKLPFEMKFIMQLLLAAICIVLFMVVIPVVVSLYIGNLYILYPVMFLYGCAIALIFNPVK